MNQRTPLPARRIRALRRQLLSWFEEQARVFPWRQTVDPYRILVAEVLLQKTIAAKVPAVYDEVIRRYPTIASLAEAEEEDIRALILPLGFSFRARHLIEICQLLTDRFGGTVPATRQELLSIHGIGDYTANAVLCFAYNHAVPLVDTNSKRVLTRYFGLELPDSRELARRLVGHVMTQCLPTEAREFNLAVFDLAALVCRIRSPRCTECPLVASCLFAKRSRGRD